MADWHKRLKGRVDLLGWSAAELSRRSGVDVQRIYKYLKGEVDNPRGTVLNQLADAIQINRLWLKEGIGPEFSRLPIVGQVSAGEGFIPINDYPAGEGYGEVDFDLGAVDPVAIEVRGTSMMPVYRPGDVLIGSRQRGQDVDQCLYEDCIVRTEADEGYLKVLTRGSEPGLYNLESYNRAYPAMENVRLSWVAPVTWVRRGRAGRRLVTVSAA